MALIVRLPCPRPPVSNVARTRRHGRTPVIRTSAAGASAADADLPPPPSVGIDLGTSNSCIAVVGPDGTPALIPLPDTVHLRPDGSATLEAGPSGPRTTLPSVVTYRADGGRVVGGAARRGAAADPANTVAGAKRLLGRSRGEVERSQQAAASSKKKGGRRAPPAWPLAQGGEAGEPVALAPPARGPAAPPLAPEAVAADVLRALLAAAAAADPAGRPPTRAVVSVPAYFSSAARAATLRAAADAGLDAVRLVREPVAAAIGYGVRAGATDETVLCLDLGGGTFDVCLLECGGSGGGGGGGGGPSSSSSSAAALNMVEVLATGGDPSLGGTDWDEAVLGWLGSEVLAPAGHADWASQPATVAALRSLAEAAKVALSDREAVVLRLPAGGGGGAGGAPPLSATLTRARLDELAAPLYTRAALAVDEACYQAGVELGATVDAFRAREAARAAAADAAAADPPETLSSQQRRRRRTAAAPALRPKARPPVSRVLLVGAPTRAPGFRSFVHNLTGLMPEEGDGDVDPDAAVALGAAVQAAALDAGAAAAAAGGSTTKKQQAGADLVVLDVLQGALARALAAKALEEDEALADRVMDKVEGGGGRGGGRGRRAQKKKREGV